MRSLIIKIILFSMLLAACQTQTGTAEGPSITENPLSSTDVGNQTNQTGEDLPLDNNDNDNESQVVSEDDEDVELTSDAASNTCNVETRRVMPTPDPADIVDIQPISDEDWVVGAENPSIAIIEYCDFQSQDCAQFDSVLDRLLEKYPQDLQVVYRHFPSVDHDKALLAAQAVEAAALQSEDSFYAMQEMLYESQEEWLNQPVEKFQTWLQRQSGVIGLNIKQFSTDMISDRIEKKISDAQVAASKVDVEATPIVIINGSIYRGPRDFLNLESIIKLQRLEEKQFSACPDTVIDEKKSYQAVLETTTGEIKIELYPQEAPMAVNSFVYLAKNGWYDRQYFHNVVENVVAQAGDPSGTGFGGPGYYLPVEVNQDVKFDQEGVVAMYQVKPGQNGSQFFITYKPMTEMDGKYTIIGKVIEGMQLLNGLQTFSPAQDGEIPDENIIISITVEEK